MTFDVEPATTDVYLDTTHVGTIQDFSVDRNPLMVVPGTHRIELRAPGYRAISFDVTIAPGQVIPFSGALHRH